jgi:branched-chain amino acid transport system permease protein
MAELHFVVQSFIDGIAVGLLYGLVGIGFSVIYNASGIVNFAQGVFVMLGGMITYSLLASLGLPLILAAALATVAVAAVGVLLDVLVVVPMRSRGVPLYGIILATLAAQIIVERLVILTAGDQPRTYPNFTAGGPLMVGGIAIGYQSIWILGSTALLVLLLWAFFAYTSTGRAVRACSQNHEAALLLGIPVRRMVMISFALSAALGAIAGILITPTQYTAFNVGEPFGIDGFIAAIIGGFGNPAGALVGGLLLGLVQSLGIVALGAAFKNIAALVVMLLVLLFFPAGVLGKAKQ